MEVEEDTDRSLERSTLTIPAEGQLQRGARMVVRFFMVSFITWVKDQPIGASEKASRAAGGPGILILIHRVCLCPMLLHLPPSQPPFRLHYNENRVIEAAKCTLWKKAGKQVVHFRRMYTNVNLSIYNTTVSKD